MSGQSSRFQEKAERGSNPRRPPPLPRVAYALFLLPCRPLWWGGAHIKLCCSSSQHPPFLLHRPPVHQDSHSRPCYQPCTFFGPPTSVCPETSACCGGFTHRCPSWCVALRGTVPSVHHHTQASHRWQIFLWKPYRVQGASKGLGSRHLHSTLRFLTM